MRRILNLRGDSGLLWSLAALYLLELVVGVTVPPAELHALQALYNSTQGDHWAWHSTFPPSGAAGNAEQVDASTYKKWNFSNPAANPCTELWYGVTCLPYTAPAPYYHISKLVLYFYKLNGTIPSAISGLSQLTILDLHVNSLHGTIPASMGTMNHLTVLYLNNNLLTGSLPQGMSGWYRMTSAQMQYNRLNGPIPSAIGNCTALVTFNVSHNQMSGSIPVEIAPLVHAQRFDLGSNYFSGTVPAAIGGLTSVVTLSLVGNLLTGPLPDTWNDMQYLKTLQLINNSFTGELPETMGFLTNAQNMQLDHNYLTGTIPNTFCDLDTLEVLALNNNLLRGSFPDCPQGSLVLLQQLLIYENDLTGTLSAALCEMTSIRQLLLADNHLVGSIPDCIGNATNLHLISLEHNELSGPIPVSINSLIFLQQLTLHNNQLTGNLDNRFNVTSAPYLYAVLLSNNLLTGTIPTVLFALPYLQNLALSINCFEGSLPNMCQGASYYITLFMDGLSSAATCRNTLFPGLFTSYTLRHSVSGTVPACLFNLPQLIALQLSGNGLTGTLPTTVPSLCAAACNDTNAVLTANDNQNGVEPLQIAPQLGALSLAHNQLTGVIPDVYQNHSWHKLDLSYNRLRGVLSDQVGVHSPHVSGATVSPIIRAAITGPINFTILSLQNNRLSGRIPTSVRQLAQVSILGSNMFACSDDGHELPVHDSGDSNYQCASNAFDTPYYVWLGLTGAATLVVVCVYGFGFILFRSTAIQRAQETVIMWYRAGSVSSEMPAVQRCVRYMTALEQIGGYCAVYLLLVLTPLYGALSATHGTFTYTYAWTISAAFLSGQTAFGLIMTALVTLLLWFAANTKRTIIVCEQELQRACEGDKEATVGQNQKFAVDGDDTVAELRGARYALVAAVFTAVNVIVVGGVCAAYVYVVIYQSSELLTAVQVLLSFFKIAWTNVAVDKVLFFTANGIVSWLDRAQGRRPRPTLTLQQLNEQCEVLQFFVSIFNFIGIPCIVVLCVSPSCFYNAFVQAPAVTTTYLYQSCLQTVTSGGACAITTESASYSPPFAYGYQCSTSLITYYAPAFVNICMVGMFVTPAVEVAQALVHRFAPRGSKLYELIDDLVPPLWKPLDPIAAPSKVIVDGDGSDPGAADGTVAAQPTISIAAENDTKPLFDPNRQMYSLLSNLALLLTFGAVFPPLGVALAATMAVSVWYMRIKLGRFLCEAQEQRQLRLLAKIESECSDVGSPQLLWSAVWALITLSCWFYTLFLFDTLGDAVGFEGAYWVLIVMPLMPLGLYGMYRLCAAWAERKLLLAPGGKAGMRDLKETPLGDVEMNPMSRPENTEKF